MRRAPAAHHDHGRHQLPAFLRKAQATGSTVPFWLRLRGPSDTAASDDVLQLTFDDATAGWPVADSVPEGTVSASLEGSLTDELDFGADVSGYAAPGTTEAHLGAVTSLTGGGFPIAAFPDTMTCTGPRLIATGISLVSGGMRIGTINLFSGQASGTIQVRASVRTQRRTCDGQDDGTSMLSAATLADTALPIPFDGTFKISPSISADGRVRLGVLVVTTATPRSAFGRLPVCADPAVADGCGRVLLPVRARLSSLRAEVMIGQNAPSAPPAP